GERGIAGRSARAANHAVVRLDPAVPENLEAIFPRVEAEMRDVHQLAIREIHRVGEQRVKNLRAKLQQRRRQDNAAAGLERFAMHLERDRLVAIREMLDEADTHNEIELGSVFQFADVADLKVDVHFIAIPDLWPAGGRIGAEKWITCRECSEAV